ncbi:PGN_0703 family putative restriction endonuclease [Hyphobacterium indicum]|uniref:PGN_0703 family putative restriction endonuclease n=1 Tax=Hyphobacterium indicum TaxID=2162714 RepID=UPI000D65B3B3|nr:hypothetical protein [Hyphobacterium indicum]
MDRESILKIYEAAPGGEIRSGKFANPASSAALAANVFGWFLDRPEELMITTGSNSVFQNVQNVSLEAEVRFPWRGGRHPSLDALIRTRDRVIGVEAKRYEPFRSKSAPVFSDAFERDVWKGLEAYNALRRTMKAGDIAFRHLDAAQLIKHALGLAAEADRSGLEPVLIYLYAAPELWPDGRAVPPSQKIAHLSEINTFNAAVAGDRVTFLSMSYRELLSSWRQLGGHSAVHADAISSAFDL